MLSSVVGPAYVARESVYSLVEEGCTSSEANSASVSTEEGRAECAKNEANGGPVGFV